MVREGEYLERMGLGRMLLWALWWASIPFSMCSWKKNPCIIPGSLPEQEELNFPFLKIVDLWECIRGCGAVIPTMALYQKKSKEFSSLLIHEFGCQNTFSVYIRIPKKKAL